VAKDPHTSRAICLALSREVILEGEGVLSLFASREELFSKKEFLLLF
jgi:hypothetical protein